MSHDRKPRDTSDKIFINPCSICGGKTYGGKPFCIEHLDLITEVIRLKQKWEDYPTSREAEQDVLGLLERRAFLSKAEVDDEINADSQKILDKLIEDGLVLKMLIRKSVRSQQRASVYRRTR